MKISEAVKAMLTHHISSAPVVNSSGVLLGQISEVVLLKLFILASQKGKENLTLKDFLQNLVKPSTVNEDEPIDSIVKVIIKSDSHRALVLNHQKQLMGIISPKDILRFLVGEQNRSGSLFQEFLILQDRIGILKDQLKASHDQVKSISTVIEKSAFMFYSLDSKGKILIANEKLHQELRYQPGELVGKTVLDLFSEESHKESLETLKKLINKEPEVKTYSTYLRKDGTFLRAEVISTSIRDDKGEFVATSTLSRPLDSEALLRSLHGIYEKE